MAFKFKGELRMRITATRLQLLLCSAVCLALCLVLPFLTGQIPQIGNALSPMHIPVLLCAFLCGPWYAAIIGAIAPLLRFMLFGMPPLFPTGVAMCFELFTYGAVAGIMYRLLPRKALHVYVSLITAMIAGRIVWGAVRFILAGLSGGSFPWSAFISGAVLNAVPGIIVHIVLIPVLVFALERALPWLKK